MCRFQFLPKVFMLFYYFCNGEILSHRFRKSQYEIMDFFFHCFLLLFPDTIPGILRHFPCRSILDTDGKGKMLHGF